MVKNGSNARSRISGGMPVPVSVTASMHIAARLRPGRVRGGVVVEVDGRGLDGQPAAARHGVAAR